MSSLFRTLQLLSITLWVGGIAFFAFVVAPVAFHHLSNAQEAGIVVRESILALHRIGLVCGAILLTTLFLSRSRMKRSIFIAQALLVALMFLLTFLSQTQILPRMERDRRAAENAVNQRAEDDPTRIRFDRLHVLSERIEGAVLLAGLGVIVLMATELCPTRLIAP